MKTNSPTTNVGRTCNEQWQRTFNMQCRNKCGLGCVNRMCARVRLTQPSPHIFLHFCRVEWSGVSSRASLALSLSLCSFFLPQLLLLLPSRDKGHFRPLLFLAFLLRLRQIRKEGGEGSKRQLSCRISTPFRTPMAILDPVTIRTLGYQVS